MHTPQLTALAYFLIWFSRERLKLPCGSSQNNLEAHFCLITFQLRSLQLSLMNLLSNIDILSWLLQCALAIQISPLYRAVISSSLIVWMAILFIIPLFALRGFLRLSCKTYFHIISNAFTLSLTVS